MRPTAWWPMIVTVCLTSYAVCPANEIQERQFQRDLQVTPLSGTLEDAIETMQMAKWMADTPDGRFHPEKNVTRAELASIIVKAFDLESREKNRSKQETLRDVPSDQSGDIALVVNLGVMRGYREHYFYPNHPVSRAEALSVIAQAYGVYSFEEAIIAAILSNYPDADQIPAWARKAVATSLKSGFSDVSPSGRIRPLQPMTRGELAYILYQYLQQSARSESPPGAPSK